MVVDGVARAMWSRAASSPSRMALEPLPSVDRSHHVLAHGCRHQAVADLGTVEARHLTAGVVGELGEMGEQLEARMRVRHRRVEPLDDHGLVDHHAGVGLVDRDGSFPTGRGVG
jgi:hypothetical protein